MSENTSKKDTSKEDIENFRNNLGTMHRSGKREWIFPKQPSGRHYKWRTYVSWVLLALLVLIPFIKIGGNPLFKFDLLNREFYVFSFPFFTSDFQIFAIGAITTLVFIILFTVVYGRIFCGWICPQTIFLEMVFRKIEYMIDGDRNKQMKLSRQEWDEEKIRKRLLKWTIYAILSFIIANIFLSWIIGVDSLIDLITEGPGAHVSTFVGLILFTGAFYFVFTWFREQACVLVCPYGRLQGVLIDKKTVNVAYDYKRGEREKGRARFKRGQDRVEEGIGDCIDCGNCVVVCPTGIDIRNGTQLECVNCTACIDACDEVMDKINLPRGLIRYASEENIVNGEKFKFTPRVMAYTFVLVAMIGLLSSFILLRPSIESKFLREPGTDYKVVNNSIISNEFQYNLQNKTKETKSLHFRLVSHENGTIQKVNGSDVILVPSGQEVQGKVLILIPKSDLSSYKEKIEIEVLDEQDNVIDTYSTSFAAPFS